MDLTQPIPPATARLIRIHLALIPVYAWMLVVWTAYAIDINGPGNLDRSQHIKGHDFAHFYVLGQIANDRAAAELYSFETQGTRMDLLVPHYQNRFEPIHGPQMAVLFGPLSRLPYERAVAVWLIFTAVSYLTCCALLWSAMPQLRSFGWIAAILALGYPSFYMLVAFGQTSVFGLASVTAGYFALRARRPWLAGFALGALVYKPAFGLALPFVLLYGREWRMIAGAVSAVMMQLGIGAAWFGIGSLSQYLDAVRHVGDIAQVLEPIPYQMQSLRSFYSVLIPSHDVAFVAYLATAAVAIVIAARCWRSAGALDLRYSVLLLVTVLTDPHVNPYDLVVIIPVFVFVAEWVFASGQPSRNLWILLYLCYYLPGLAFLPERTHVQFSVIAMSALVLMLVKRSSAVQLDGQAH